MSDMYQYLMLYEAPKNSFWARNAIQLFLIKSSYSQTRPLELCLETSLVH